jgi:hypothetical protein
MESALYVKSMMTLFLLIICFAIFSNHILLVGNVIAGQWRNNSSHECNSTPYSNTNNAAYPRLNQTLSIRGIVNLSDSSVILKPSMILPSSTLTTLPAHSPLAIDLLDKEGRVIVHYPIDIIISSAKVEEWKNIAYISEAVPYYPCTTKIAITKDDKEMVSQVVSPNAPEIKSIKVSDTSGNSRLIFPRTNNITVEWEAEDLDGDNLSYILLYSNDGGRTWPITVADEIKETSLTLNANSLPGNSAYLSQFRVIATDGVNTDVRDSNSFSIPSLNIGH